MLIEILRHTPVWVFVLFVALIALGVWQSRPRIATAQRAAALPIAMVALSGFSVWSTFHASGISVRMWLTGLALGVLLRQSAGLPRGLRYVAADRTFAFAGSWLPLALMMTIFFPRYAVAVSIARDSHLVDVVAFVVGVCLWYGALSGLFFSNVISLWRASRDSHLVDVVAFVVGVC